MPRLRRRHCDSNRSASTTSVATAPSSDSNSSGDDGDLLSRLVQSSSRLLQSSNALLDSQLQVQSTLERILIDDPPPRRTANTPESDSSTLERRLETLEAGLAQLQVDTATHETRSGSRQPESTLTNPPNLSTPPARRTKSARSPDAMTSGTVRIHASSRSVAIAGSSSTGADPRSSAARQSLERLFALDHSTTLLAIRPDTKLDRRTVERGEGGGSETRAVETGKADAGSRSRERQDARREPSWWTWS